MRIVGPSTVAVVVTVAAAATSVLLCAQTAAAAPQAVVAPAPRTQNAPGAQNPAQQELPPLKLPTQAELARFAQDALQRGRQAWRYSRDAVASAATAVARTATDLYDRIPGPRPRVPPAFVGVCVWLAYRAETAIECRACTTIPVQYPPYYVGNCLLYFTFFLSTSFFIPFFFGPLSLLSV